MKIKVGKNEWNITVLGNGENLLVAFHGYGQNHAVFEHLSELMHQTHSIWCIDLAYHGANQTISSDFLFDDEYAKELIHQVLLISGKSQIGLMGYSIGGRIAISAVQVFPNCVTELFLLAPDGLPVSKAYNFLTHTVIGNFLFKSFVNHAGFAVFLIKIGKAAKIFSSKLADYYLFEIATHDKRKQLHDTWMAYKKAIPNKQQLLNWNKKGDVTCVLGKHDGIIPVQKTQKYLKKFLPNSRVIILEAGHNLLSEKAVKRLSDYF